MSYATIPIGSFPRLRNKAPMITFQKNGLIRFSKYAAEEMNLHQGDYFEILVKGKGLAIRKTTRENVNSLRIQTVKRSSLATTTCYKVSNRVLIEHLAKLCDWPFGPGRLTDIKLQVSRVEDSDIFELF